MNLIETVSLDNEIISNIALNDSPEITEFITEKKKRISTNTDALNSANIEVNPLNLKAISNTRLSRKFSDKIRKNYNTLNMVIYIAKNIISDLPDISMKSIHVDLAIINDTLSSLEGVLQSVNKFDPKDPISFYKI